MTTVLSSSSSTAAKVAVMAVALVLLTSSALQPVAAAAAAKKAVPGTRAEVMASFEAWVESVGAKHAVYESAAKSTGSSNVEELASKVGEWVIVVDQSGAGNYKTINEAINAVPLHNKSPVTIKVNAGTYVSVLLPNMS